MISKHLVLISCLSTSLYGNDFHIADTGNSLTLQEATFEPADTAAITLPVNNVQPVIYQANDTITQDSIPATEVRNRGPRGAIFQAEARYSARDSIIFHNDKIFLYGNASVSYQDIVLTAHFIELDLANNIAFAAGTKDSLGVETGLPVFRDNSGEYTMRSIRYNFETEKAIIEHVVTTQGEGFIVSERAKKNPDNTFYIKDGRYTTCDHHENPHFYLRMTRAKVIPGDRVIAGPSFLVIKDIPIYPLVIPFAFVPSTRTYTSGFLTPSYGEESNRGFFLRDGGYYWAVNDFFDLSLTGDIYSNGSWGLRASSNYRVRYKFSGGVNLQRITNLFSERDLPDFRQSNDFSITWNHRQDAKANPYRNLSANVNFTTSSFNQNNVGSVINPNLLAQNITRSSINLSQRFPESPFSLNLNASASQNTRDSTLNVSFPDLSVAMRSIFPFKRENRLGGDERWFERLSLSYTGNMKNDVTTHERDFSISPESLANDWRNGVLHRVPVNLDLKMFRYFTLNPNFNYTERWYFRSIEKGWDENRRAVVNTDTIAGFSRVFDYNFGVGTSTKLYTFFRPSRAIFGDRIDAIRHVMSPSVSLNYTPDFSHPRFGYFNYLEYYDPTRGETVRYEYSPYEGAIFGVPGGGESGSLGFSLGNNLEMKVRSDADTTGFRKIALLESLNFSSSYNFLADSLHLSRINMSGRTTIFGTSISFGAVFNPYALDTLSNGRPVIVDRFEWADNRRLARMESANLSFGINLSSDMFKPEEENEAGTGQDPLENQELSPEEQMFDGMHQHLQGQNAVPVAANGMEAGEDGYAAFEIPWSISLNYSMRVVPGNFNRERMAFDHRLSANVNITGQLTLTPKWNISFSSGYNLDTRDISHTNLRINRNLHCWNMSFNLVPIGRFKSYFFTISANSSLLRDLKFDKRSHPRDNPNWF